MATFTIHIDGTPDDQLYTVEAPSIEVVQQAAQETAAALAQQPTYSGGSIVPNDSHDQGTYQQQADAERRSMVTTLLGNHLESSIRANRPVTQQVGDWTRDLLNGLTVGHEADLMGGINAIVPGGPGFNEARDFENQQADLHRQESPIGSMLVEGLGGAATAGGMAKAGLSPTTNARPTIGAVAPAAAAEGAAYGGVYGSGQGDSLAERGRNALAGAATGGVVGGVLGGVGGTLANRSIAANAPTDAAIQAQKQALYNAANQVGVRFETNAFDQNTARMAQMAQANTTSHPQTSAILDRLRNIPADPTLEQVDGIRQDLSRIARTDNPNAPGDRYLAGKMLTELDGYLGQAAQNPALVIPGSGSAVDALALIQKARALHRVGLAGETVQTAADNAAIGPGARAGSTQRQADLANQFRAMTKDPDRMRLFSPQEQKIIHQIAAGGKVENGLRLLGRLAPQNSMLPLMTVAGAAGSYAAGGKNGLLGWLGGVGGAMGSGRVSSAMTSQNADLLGALARSGGKARANPAIQGATQMFTNAAPGAVLDRPAIQDRFDYLLPAASSPPPIPPPVDNRLAIARALIAQQAAQYQQSAQPAWWQNGR